MSCEKYVKEIVDRFERDHTKDILKRTDDLFKIVVDFLIKEDVVMYGGWAINKHLPKKKQFYEADTLNDFDGFVVSAKNVANKLLNKIKGYKYVEIRETKHPNTFKVVVQGIPLCDITDVSKKEYELLLANAKRDNDTGLLLSSTNDLKRMMLNELSQPIQSAFRWSKVHSRFFIFLSAFPEKNKSSMQLQKIFPSNDLSACIKKLLGYIKEKGLPLVGNVAIQLHNDQILKPYTFGSSQPFLSILAEDYKKVMRDVIEMFNDVAVSMISLWDTKRVSVYMDGVFVMDIVDCSTMCLSVMKSEKRGYRLGSVATIGYLLYDEISFYTDAETDDLKRSAMLCSKLMKKCDKMMSIVCYGKGKWNEDVVKEYWNKKFYRQKKKIGSKDRTLL